MENNSNKSKKPWEIFLAFLGAVFSLLLTVLAVKFYPDLVTPQTQTVQSQPVAFQSQPINDFFTITPGLISIILIVAIIFGVLFTISIILRILDLFDIFDFFDLF